MFPFDSTLVHYLLETMYEVKIMNKLMRDFQGFTLLELLVGVGIIAILAAMAAPSYVQFSHRNKVRGAVREIQSVLQLARMKTSVTGNPHVVIIDDNESNDGIEAVYLLESLDGGATFNFVTTGQSTIDISDVVDMDVGGDDVQDCPDLGPLPLAGGGLAVRCSIMYNTLLVPTISGLFNTGAGNVVVFQKDPPGVGGVGAKPYSLNLPITNSGVVRTPQSP